MKFVRAILPGAVGMLISMSAAAQGALASEGFTSSTGQTIEPAMMRVARYPEEMYALPACFRVGRCSAYDLYRFRDRPNRLTRLAPEAPTESVAEAGWIPYRWFLVPVTPEESILPPYRAASQVRDEYRAVGRPMDGPN